MGRFPSLIHHNGTVTYPFPPGGKIIVQTSLHRKFHHLSLCSMIKNKNLPLRLTECEFFMALLPRLLFLQENLFPWIPGYPAMTYNHGPTSQVWIFPVWRHNKTPMVGQTSKQPWKVLIVDGLRQLCFCGKYQVLQPRLHIPTQVKYHQVVMLNQ